METSRLWRPLAALTGVVAALSGAAAGHLVAALTDPATSPVLAVGSTVIDATPTPVKEWAVARFGTADKPILIGSVLAGVLLLAAGAGLLARRRFAYGAGALVGLVALAAGAALTRPAAGPLDVVPSLAAAAVGVAALAWLHGRTPRRTAAPAAGPTRRHVLIAGGLLAAGAAAATGVGQWLTGLRADPSDVTLPDPTKALDALPDGLDVRGVSPFVTPNRDFYRIDTRLTLPTVSADDWTLTIDGDVDREVTFSYDDIAAMPLVERDITLTCVSNEVGGPYVGAARWLGVPLTDLLDRAGIDGTGADQILSTDVDGMTISTPLEVALDGREPLLAIGMNGEPLPKAHGFPARLVTPGLYGYVGSTKWVTRLTLTTYAEQVAYWTERDWATDAPIKVSSRIDTPRPLSRSDAGPLWIAGVAWAQQRGVAKVEVRVDGGAWRAAELGPSAGVDYWRQWKYRWDATPGQHLLAVRATTEDGEVQTAVRAKPFPDGSSGIQEIAVAVA